MSKKEQLTLESIGGFLSKLAEKSDSVYWLSSPDFEKIQYISPAYEKIWGRSREDLYRKPELWITYLHPEDAKDYNPIIEMKERVAELGAEARYDETYRIIRPDGHVRWLFDRGFPIYDSSGNCCGVTGIAVDVTKEKEAEVLLKQAKEAAEAANQAKSEFIENMSHDLRTPLTGMIGLTEELSTSNLTPIEVRSYSSKLNKANNRLLNLLNEILELSQLEKNCFLGRASVFDLREVSREAIDLLVPLLEKKEVQFNLKYCNKIPALLVGQKVLFHRVLLNLLGNAIKFTDEGEINLTVSLKEENNEHVTILLEVQDTGIGIPKNKQDTIFDSFTRLSSSYEGTHQGMGLGLHIVKEFIEAMEGSITVKSEEGKGSIFSCIISFRRPAADEEAAFLEEAPKIISDENHAVFEPVGKILIVEDDKLAQQVGIMKLKKWHCVVDAASSGEEALLKMKKNNYDMIYLDIGLPDIKGTEVAERFRAWEKEEGLSKTPLVALTAHVDEKNKGSCISCGINDVLNKPLSNEMAEYVCSQYVRKKILANSDKERKEIAPEGPEEPVIDLELGESLLGSREAALEILASLIETLPDTIIELKNAFNQKDWDQLKFSVHKLHGGTCYTGTPRLKAAALALEMDLIEGHMKAEKYYKHLILEINAVLKARTA